jgi:hypothetical protein
MFIRPNKQSRDGAARLTGVLLAVSFLAAPAVALGAPEAAQPPTETAITSDYAITATQLYELGFVTLIGLVTLILQSIMLGRARAHALEGMRLMLVTLIVTLSVGMLIVGFNERQITPVIGLFGSAVGYLLGRSERGPQAESPTEKR